MQDAVPKTEHSPKRAVAATHVINWYIGNYLESTNNALRDNSFDPEKGGWQPAWLREMEVVRTELGGGPILHSDFIRLMKEKGIHGKYYLYKKYECHCRICKAMGIV